MPKAVYPLPGHKPARDFPYSCAGKTPYKSRKDAEHALRLMRNKPSPENRFGARRGAYCCPVCSTWHWGHEIG